MANNNKMLIDASHPEETRVVVLRGNRIEEFDFESASKKPLRGNIYLAKVTRVEPSLQAAFIEYGGNRHGFLAFPEIHPDYYQIPVADRQALLEEEALERSEEEAEEEERRPQRNRRRRKPDDRARRRRNGDAVLSADAPQPEIDPSGPQPFLGEFAEGEGPQPITAELLPPQDDDAAQPQQASTDYTPAETANPAADADRTPAQEGIPHESAGYTAPPSDESPVQAADETREDQRGEDPSLSVDADASPDRADSDGDGEDEDEDGEGDSEEESVEQIGGDAEEFMPRAVRRTRRQYKIQEVIKRRQVMLVQVVKEERGNKGAALTTYLSLAGRYSVLMPNTARGGGISRKITDGDDRRRLKEIVQDLDVPDGMGVILRTAGASRSTEEVRRDFEYLLRMWESVRELTLGSTAP
ncbi:MAG: ribonuclease E/G, partial [Alphaproteobacteria bacterium]|nr:ribonuclease E/G [Alphaproteobacteria bacterium]